MMLLHFADWRQLGRSARLYLLHAALLTGSLALYGAFFNFAIPALGFDLQFLGLLNTVSIAVAALLSLPLWWLVTRIGLQRSLLLSALLQALGIGMTALWPSAAPLLIGVGLTGAAATIFQVSAPPFMMEQSDATTRDQVFSANAAVNIGFAGIVTFFAGDLKSCLGAMLGVGAESASAYRAIFACAGLGMLLALLPLLAIRRHAAHTSGEVEHAVQAALAEPALQPGATVMRDDGPSWLLHLPLLVPLVERLPPHVRQIVRQPLRVLPLLVSPLLISFGAAALFLYLNVFFKQRFGLSDTSIARILALLNITTGLVALAGPAISTRIGKVPTIVLTQLLSIPFLLILGFVPVLGIAVGAALVRGALFNMASPLYDAFAMERTDEAARPIVIGLINGAYTVGYLISPTLSTWTQARYGFAPLFVVTALCYGLAAVMNYWLFLSKRSTG